ncbi:hypothetical protein ACIQ8G_25630 [Streptomyces sp. NPDC094154]|nr:hypothetical protein [Streptomyces sp. NBC_01788]WSB26156.1 hypothetical protein OIE49_09790 [Streptomyces sp. NBC_01788]
MDTDSVAAAIARELQLIEQGHASPKVDTLIRIAVALDTPLADLVR